MYSCSINQCPVCDHRHHLGEIPGRSVLLIHTTPPIMATYNDVDKNDANALHLLGIMKDVISDAKKQDSNKTPNDKGRNKDGRKNNGNPADTTTTNNTGPTWEQLEKVLSTYTYHIAALFKDHKNETGVIIDELKDENKDLKKKLVTKSLDLEKLQQYQNRDVIKICGAAEPTGLGPRDHENTNETVQKIFSKLNNTIITDQDISVTHRIRSKVQRSGQPKAILLKTSRRDFRNKLMRMKRDMRESQEFKADYPDIFMVEHLTPKRSKVAYKLRNDPAIEKCWTIDGKIKVVKVGASTSDKPITIDSLADLKDLGWHQNDIDELALSE